MVNAEQAKYDVRNAPSCGSATYPRSLAIWVKHASPSSVETSGIEASSQSGYVGGLGSWVAVGDSGAEVSTELLLGSSAYTRPTRMIPSAATPSTIQVVFPRRGPRLLGPWPPDSH